ncbi:hypothetical protein D9M68_621200 [compost metagenome]
MQGGVVTGDGGIKIRLGEVDLPPLVVQVLAGAKERDELHGLGAGVVEHAHSLPGRSARGF